MATKRTFTEKQIKNIIEMYNNGNCVDIIRKKYHVRNITISNILKENNIRIKKTHEYYTSEEMATQRKYYCDESIFENIDDHDKAYWLGFLFADGNVHIPKGKDGDTKGIIIELSLKEEDYYHLRNFSQFIKSNYPVKKKIIKLNGNEFVAYRVSIGSVKMGRDLISHGCVPCKSLILEYPKNMDDKYFGSFLCGYFDGDGCISHHNYNRNGWNEVSDVIKFLGTFEFLSIVKNKLESLGIKTRNIRKCDSKAYELTISNYSHSDFYNLIYNKSSYMLGRKFDKFREMLYDRDKDFEASEVSKLAKYIL